MELETAARRFLLQQQAVKSYVVEKVFKYTLTTSPEGTGGYAIVVRRQAGWAVPDPVKTSEFPRLVVECWADPDRDTDKNRAVDNAPDKALALYRVVDRLLHGQRDVIWGAGGTNPGLRVVTCARAGEPPVISGADAAGLGRVALIGDMAVVPVVYNLQLG